MGFDSSDSVVTPSQYTKYTVSPIGRIVTRPLRRMPPSCFIKRAISLLLRGFDELERHAVGFADGVVLRVVELRVVAVLRRLAHRRKRPHAERVILRVLWIRVDLGFARKLEAGLLDLRDHVRLRHVAVV